MMTQYVDIVQEFFVFADSLLSMIWWTNLIFIFDSGCEAKDTENPTKSLY